MIKPKVKLVTQNKQFNQILPVGFETKITPLFTNSGLYNGYSFVAADGETYTSVDIRKLVGPLTIDKIFELQEIID